MECILGVQRKAGVYMANKKESAFLRQVTLGLFNKKGVQFRLTSAPWGGREGGKFINIDIRFDSYKVGERLSVEISYVTSEDTVSVAVKDESFGNPRDIWKKVPKGEAPIFIKNWLAHIKKTKNKAFSRYNDQVDYYAILDRLSFDIFEVDDVFEIHAWKKTTDIDIYFGLREKGLTNKLGVSGAIGSQHNRLKKGVTFSVEFANKDDDKKNYLHLKSVVRDGKYPVGMHANATLDMFTTAILDQYWYGRYRAGHINK